MGERVVMASIPVVVGHIAEVPGSWSGALDAADRENPLLPDRYGEDILLDLPVGAPIQLSLEANFYARLQILNSETQKVVASDAQPSLGANAQFTITP